MRTGDSKSTNKFFLWFFSQQKDVFDVFFAVDVFEVLLIENRTIYLLLISKRKINI